MNKNKKIKTGTILCGVLLLLVMMFNTIITRHVSKNILDGDTSGDMILSRLMYEDRVLANPDWFYGTEPQFMPQLFYAPFFAIFDGWANVRFCGTVLLQLLYLASFLFMTRVAGFQWGSAFLGGALLMSPYCVAYGRCILYHGFYIIQSAIVFLTLGLFFKLTEETGKSRKLIFGSLLVLTVALGCVKGIRQFVSTVIPLVLILAVCLFRQGERSQRARDLWKPWMLWVPVIAFAGGMGLLFCMAVLQPRFGFLITEDQRLVLQSAETWQTILGAVLSQFGYRIGAKAATAAGLLSLMGLCAGAYGLIRSLNCLLRGDMSDIKRFFLKSMFAAQMGTSLLIFLLTEMPFQLRADYSRYLVMSSLWWIPLFAAEAEDGFPLWQPKGIAVTLCLLTLGGNSLYNGGYYLSPDRFPQEYDGLAYNNIRQVEQMRGAVEYIRTHGYVKGYAMPDDANAITEMTNGLPVIPLTMEPTRLYYDDSLTGRSIRSIDTDRAFLLLRKEHRERFESIKIPTDCELLYFDDDGVLVYEFSNDGAFRDYLASQENTYQKFR